MVEPADELRTRAAILHKAIAAGHANAQARLRALPEFAKADEGALELAASTVQRKHCLAVVARESGFSTWAHALRVLRGDADERDFGTLLYDAQTRGMLNAWFADHAQARAHLLERRAGGHAVYLLAYKRQFLVVEDHFIRELGLDPADPDWNRLGFDWARPDDRDARQRLYAKRLGVMRRGT